MTARSTIVLGTEYAGTPCFGSLALTLHHMEQRGDADGARKMLDAHNMIATAFGGKPIDLAQQFTCSPNSMATLCPRALAVVEHRQGFEPREIDRVVERTARAA